MEQSANIWTEPLIVIGAASLSLLELALLGAGLVGVYLWHRRQMRGREDTGAILELVEEQREALARAHAQLEGRLSQLSDASNAQHAALRENLDQRLESVSRRMQANLSETTQKTHHNLTQLHERLAVIQNAQTSIKELTTEVTSLQALLSNKQKRGAFGEIQMQDLVTNFLPKSAVAFQHSLSTGVRVDCLIKLPNPPGPVAVDAKFPLEGWRRFAEAEDDLTRDGAARAFRADVLKHVRDIAEKYLIHGETADTALMFLPSEAVYATLHVDFPDLVEKAFRARVMIVSPTTFMATLHTMRAVMKDARLREQAGEVQKIVGWLSDDIRRIDERVQALQKHHDKSAELMGAVRKTADRAMGRAQRIEDLQLEEPDTDEALAPPPPARPPLNAPDADEETALPLERLAR